MIKNHIDFQTSGISTFSVTLLALVMFFIYITGYALLVFIQFSPLQILVVGLTFAALLAALTALFMRPALLGITLAPIRINLKTIGASLFVFFVLIIFTHSTNPVFSAYFQTFPLLEAELGLGWHPDAAYHVSHIQSILNFGYPSIAQHGHPLTAYHTLSHYVDALILLITQVDPYDSYGLFFHYKIFLFLSSILLAVTAMTRKHGVITYFVSFVLFAPCVIGTWHAIGSHGLWMATVILLLSAHFVFCLLFKKPDLTLRQFAALFLIIVSIGLAKISSGFMYGALLGAFILIKQPRQIYTYAFGAALITFFYLYGVTFFSSLNNVQSSIDISSLGLPGLFNYLTASQIVRGGRTIFSYTHAILACAVILVAIVFQKANKNIIAGLLATALAIVCLYFITETISYYSISDIWYFQYGLVSGLLLLTFASVLHHKQELNKFPPATGAAATYRRSISIAGLACIALLMKYTVPLPSFTHTSPFLSINQKLSASEQVTVLSSRSAKAGALEKLSSSRPLKALQNDVKKTLDDNNLSREETGLVLSKEFFDNQFRQVGGVPWARGLLVYATTGVQLLYGVTEIPRGYGYTEYYKPFTARSDQFVNDNDLCVTQDVVNVVILYSSTAEGELIDCRK